ncbi:7858_t:CDS:1 [Acaulospora colombiana]|uniref:7858_t:CDS:1 n=1 Tax=Acaulospora colombiana TaxID=27376 RepID=A0ACA9MLF1_9GLOM|nr:7858_t:CDS:1 [Acaulospora colombiana]
MKAFRYKDYRPNPRQTTPIPISIKDSLLPVDLFNDFKFAVLSIYNRLLGRPSSSNLWPNDRPTPEEDVLEEKKGFWEEFWSFLTSPFSGHPGEAEVNIERGGEKGKNSNEERTIIRICRAIGLK